MITIQIYFTIFQVFPYLRNRSFAIFLNRGLLRFRCSRLIKLLKWDSLFEVVFRPILRELFLYIWNLLCLLVQIIWSSMVIVSKHGSGSLKLPLTKILLNKFTTILLISNLHLITGLDKPNLVEVGPYVYRQKMEKVDVNFSNSEPSVTYKVAKQYFFAQELSCPGKICFFFCFFHSPTPGD